jgi:hypothetical protein
MKALRMNQWEGNAATMRVFGTRLSRSRETRSLGVRVGKVLSLALALLVCTGVVALPVSALQSTSMFAEVNAQRSALGAGPLAWTPRLDEAATAHAGYVAHNYERRHRSESVSDHEERWQGEGFTGRTPRERIQRYGVTSDKNWELIAFFGDGGVALDAWMASLYHRIPLIHPNATAMGYGRGVDGRSRIDVVEVTASSTSQVEGPVCFPADRATEVARLWTGAELPQPQLPSSDYPSGPVITLTFPFGVHVEGGAFLLSRENEVLADCHWLHPGNDPHLKTTQALIPLDPLDCLTWHHVLFQGRVDGASAVIEWDFRTGP